MTPECNCGHTTGLRIASTYPVATFVCRECCPTADPLDANTGPGFDDLEPAPGLRIDWDGERRRVVSQVRDRRVREMLAMAALDDLTRQFTKIERTAR